MSFFPLYGQCKNRTKVDLDLSNYSTKSDLKNSTGVNISQFAKKYDLPNL